MKPVVSSIEEVACPVVPGVAVLVVIEVFVAACVITRRATSPIVNNTPLIAGLVGGLGAFACSFAATVVFFLRRRAKNNANNTEQGIDLPPLTSTQPHDSFESAKNPANQYRHIAIQSVQVDHPGYHSARYNQENDNYQDLGLLQQKLEKKSPEGNYGDPQDLERLNREMLYSNIGLGGQNHEKSHYSDPNDRVRELEANPPQANYGNAEDLKRMNNEVLNSALGSD